MNDLEWMERICDPDRKLTKHPLRIDFDGTMHTIATDANVLVDVQADSSYPMAVQEDAERVRDLLIHRSLDDYQRARLPDLKSWLEAPTWYSDEPCEYCVGKGRGVCRQCHGQGYSTCECPDCGHEHECHCDACDDGIWTCESCGGNGKWGPRLKIRPGWIRGELVNRELLARALHSLEGDVVTLRTMPLGNLGNVLDVCGGGLRNGWRVVLSPLNTEVYPGNTFGDDAPWFDAEQTAAG